MTISTSSNNKQSRGNTNPNIRLKSQSKQPQPNLNLRLPSDHLANPPKTDQPVVLQSVKNFIEEVQGSLDDNLHQIINDQKKDLITVIGKYAKDDTQQVSYNMTNIVATFSSLNYTPTRVLEGTVTGHKFISNLSKRYHLCIARLLLLDKFSGLILDKTTKETIYSGITEYYNMMHAEISVPLIDDAKGFLSFLETVAQASTAEDKSKILNDNTQFTQDMNTVFGAIINGYDKMYRLSYRLFKKILSMILSSIEFQNPVGVSYARGLVYQVIGNHLVNRHDYIDGHYFLELLRIYHFGPVPNPNVYGMPFFKKEEMDQVTMYLTEHHNLLVLMMYYTSHNVPDKKVDPTIFNFLPVSKIINKEPSKFFNQPVSKNTYSLLLIYLTSVTYALTLSTFEYLNKHDKQQQ